VTGVRLLPTRRVASAVAAAALAGVLGSVLRAQTPSSCAVAGTITSARSPLPGVVISLLGADDQPVDVTSTAPDGTYVVRVPGPGQYRLKAELVAFATVVRALTLDQASCQQRIDLSMTLASRAPAQPLASATNAPPQPAGAASASAPQRGGNQAGGRGRAAGTQARGRGQQAFQTLDLLADDSAVNRGDETSASESTAQALLPPGFSPDTSSESVTSIGSSQATADAFVGPGGFGDRLNAFGDDFGGRGDGRIGGGGRGGDGGPGGFGGLGNAVFLGRGRGGNQVRGSVFQSFDASGLDAAPYALNGQPTTKPDYLQQRFGATLGGSVAIPGIWDKAKTFFFLNYTGNHSRNPYDAYSTVPTLAERAGDLSGVAGTVLDPATGHPFADNQIPSARIDPAVQRLLNLFPLPNQTGDKNFHTVTTTTSNLDDVNLRLIHTFGTPPPRGRGQRGQGGGRGGIGGGRGRQGVSNLNIAVHFRRSENTNQNPFPTLGGTTLLKAWDVPVGYSFTKAGMMHSVRLGFNRQSSDSQNLYAFNQNIAGDAGLLGVSTDPFDWGAPAVSIGGALTSLRDTTPLSRTDQTISIGDTIVKTIGKHTMRYGVDLRSIHSDSRNDANARGSYVFTGLYTGNALGDFLLGLPQQSTMQDGRLDRFRQRTFDAFLQDDWRWKPSLTINAGLRYEYYSPYSEAAGQLATLDASPAFTAAVPVTAGGTSPFSGALPATIVRPFRTGYAPRVGIAWKAQQATTVRAGYGINYNASVYQSIAQQLAAQPPFVQTGTVLATAAAPLPIETALTTITPGLTTNTYGVDPNYRLGYVQIWNADVQRDIARTYTFGIGYTGTKGSNLDILRAPNRNPDGTLRIAGVVPFIWESSEGDSILQSVTVRFRKRQTHGIAAGITYTLSKSIDDASSIGGSGAVVAQNDQDLAAERGLSSFDQRHRLSADFTLDLPFGANKRWFNGNGAMATLLGNWQVNGNMQIASGTPFTARVLGAITDVATGVNGTLRANYNGLPITISDLSAAEFFNKAAFSLPAPGTFGNAGRNTIIGPGMSVLNMGLTRNINFGQTRGMSIQLIASNVLNTVQFASIDTIVNDFKNFGTVTAARPMRRVQILTRFRF
jgi:trimeric autotransporter adhesin